MQRLEVSGAEHYRAVRRQSVKDSHFKNDNRAA